MKFEKLIETRFADPITAIDLSRRYVCHGSAMGRIVFYSIREDKDIALSDSYPELIRGVILFTFSYYDRSLIQKRVTIYLLVLEIIVVRG
jgi:hypothetical protein